MDIFLPLVSNKCTILFTLYYEICLIDTSKNSNEFRKDFLHIILKYISFFRTKFKRLLLVAILSN